MSILIKGAEMPTNCMGCPYEIYANCIIYQAVSARDYSDCRHPDCPLVEIPSHGRLIDGDKLEKRFQKVATEAWKMKLNVKVETVWNQAIDYIDQAPTVIESEKDEHE